MAPELRRGLSAAYHQGSLVWAPFVEVNAQILADGTRKRTTTWRRGTVEAIEKRDDGDSALHVKLEEDGTMIETRATECCLQNERDDAVDDLVRSDFLHEPGILHTLQVRYGQDAIYTYSGSILIAANPHKRLKHLYGPRMMGQYRGSSLGELSPHPYAIAEAAFAAMIADDQRQAILISGESGAGKTESAKMVMQYLAHRAGGGAGRPSTAAALPPAANGSGSGNVSAPIEEQVLESNPLLEAFGNAKTARNDNSSRFGKFVEIDFDATGRVTGAAISTYLLERSRVVSIRSPERSFHAFYQLCAGADEELRAELGLAATDAAQSFRYLSQSDAIELDDVDDGEAFRHTLDAMRIVGLDEGAIHSTWCAVAAILHLGNVNFAASTVEDDEAAVADPVSRAALENAARLLGVTGDGLLTAVTTRAIETRGERIIKVLDPVAAAESRDALAKSIYSRLFDWLVAAVNRKIGAVGGGGRTARSIGILDIYGFECFDNNSFEQLCINLANEKLQQAFNGHIFKAEQAEYVEEGIDWSYVEFVDNQDVLDLLEGDTSNAAMGVFPLIDEACRLPRASYQDLAHALRTRLDGTNRFRTPKRDQYAFAVEHYAGEVCYSTEGLLDKNRDFVVSEHASLMHSSDVKLLRELFPTDPQPQQLDGAATDDGTPTAAGGDSAGKRRSGFMLTTVGTQFRRQLGGLMGTLGECQPHFIRCIKPNPESLPRSLVPSYVLEQLRAGGVLEAVRIACAGFPTRKLFLPFAQRFACLLGQQQLGEMGLPLTPTGFVQWEAMSNHQVSEVVRRVVQVANLEGGQWQMGKTRVFLRSGQLAQLEGARGRLLAAAALKVQTVWRGYEARKELLRARDAATRIAAYWRRCVAIREAQERREQRAAVRMQAAWKSHAARKAFILHQQTVSATRIQAAWRGRQARLWYLEETEAGRRRAEAAAEEAARAAAATRIQAQWRRIQASRQVDVLRKQALRFKLLQEEKERLAEERSALAEALSEAEARAARAEADTAAKAAQIVSLETHVEELSTKVEAARAEVTAAASAGAEGAAAAQAAASQRAAELEAVHMRSMAALKEELEVAKSQRAAADASQSTAEVKARELQSELDRMLAALSRTESELEQRAEELLAVREELEATKQTAKAAETAATTAAVEAAAQASDALRQATELADAAAAEAAEAQRAAVELETARSLLADAEAASALHAAALKDSQERASQLSARVEALSQRVERLEVEARAAANRETALLRELESAKLAPKGPTPRASARTPLATPLRRAIGPELDSAVTPMRSDSAGAGEFAEAPTPELPPARANVVDSLVRAAVQERLPLVTVWTGAAGTLSVPQSAWLLHRCMVQWARDWAPSEIVASSRRLEDAICAAVDADSTLGTAGYWLSASLATGALLKMRGVGKRDLEQLFRLADSFLGLTDLHMMLGGIVAQDIPVVIGSLLSEEAKRSARRRIAPRQPAIAALISGAGSGGSSPGGASTPVTPAAAAGDGAVAVGAIDNMSAGLSPIDVELAHMGPAEGAWRALLGGIANVVETLRAQGVPPPAVRAVVWASLNYIDGELLNALLLRRDCCSVSAAKALQTGLTALHDVAAFVGPEWSPGPEDVARALERSSQGAKFLVQGKDDCARKALRGIDVLPDLMRQCKALTLQQVHRLAEHQHDDWLAGAGTTVGNQTVVLLEALRKLMAEHEARIRGNVTGPSSVSGMGSPGMATPGPPGSITPEFASPAAPSDAGGSATPGSATWVAFGTEEVPAIGPEMDEEDLLVDSMGGFAMFRVHHTITRKLLQDAARSFVTPPAGGGVIIARASPTKSPEALRAAAPSPLSLLDAIDHNCSAHELPPLLEADPNFEFLIVA